MFAQRTPINPLDKASVPERKGTQVTANRLEVQHSCFGPEKPYGLDPNPESDFTARRPHRSSSKFILWIMLLLAFTVYSGYQTSRLGPGASSDRWTGLFALSMIVLAFALLLRIPRIANSRAFKRH
jgi:hypothetical protein